MRVQQQWCALGDVRSEQVHLCRVPLKKTQHDMLSVRLLNYCQRPDLRLTQHFDGEADHQEEADDT